MDWWPYDWENTCPNQNVLKNSVFLHNCQILVDNLISLSKNLILSLGPAENLSPMLPNWNPPVFFPYKLNLYHVRCPCIDIYVILTHSAWDQKRSLKTEYFIMFYLTYVFSKSHVHQSLCAIHVIKSTHPNFEHTKYEPDMSNHARKNWGVKIALVFRTPCSKILLYY